ncbi:hypothetical protein Tco_1388508, partial [Tanacetum coccineum]
VLSDGSSDEYYSSDEIEEFDDVDFHTEGEENVVIKNLTTHDPFLNKLYGNNGMFRDYLDENDWRSLLVYCGRSVEGGRCAGKYSNKKKKIKKSLFPDEDAESSKSTKSAPKSSKKDAKSTKTAGKSAKSAGKSTKSTGKSVKSGIKKKGSSKSQPSKSPQTSPKTHQTLPKWTKKKIMDAKNSILVCGFRLWASWMHNEHSFQINSLHDDHKCSRNYRLDSLVIYKWIAYHFSKDIINDPFIPYIKMRDQIRQRFLIDVSLGQCKRAKKRALYNHEGGLIKHYGRGRGELLTAMGRDANNQMYPIAWVVVKVENIEN